MGDVELGFEDQLQQRPRAQQPLAPQPPCVPTARGTVRSGRNASVLLGGVQESSSSAL